MRDANGCLLNGATVQESGFSGTAIIPNLDSIAEFRILTNNFDAEYGAYADGQINVLTKPGTDRFHGDMFEFVRNTVLQLATSTTRFEARTSRTSLAARWAAPSNATSCSSSPTIRETVRSWDRAPVRCWFLRRRSVRATFPRSPVK
jgi:hypothetical protein